MIFAGPDGAQCASMRGEGKLESETTLDDLESYYHRPQLAGLIRELIDATAAEIDRAYDRQERAVEALADAYQAIR